MYEREMNFSNIGARMVLSVNLISSFTMSFNYSQMHCFWDLARAGAVSLTVLLIWQHEIKYLSRIYLLTYLFTKINSAFVRAGVQYMATMLSDTQCVVEVVQNRFNCLLKQQSNTVSCIESD